MVTQQDIGLPSGQWCRCTKQDQQVSRGNERLVCTLEVNQGEHQDKATPLQCLNQANPPLQLWHMGFNPALE